MVFEHDGYDYVAFTIKIGNQALYRRGTRFNPEILVIDIDKNDGATDIIISDEGPSDDPESFCFSYSYGQLFDLGKLEGSPSNTRGIFKVNGDGTITTPIRGNILQTWWHKVDYVRNDHTNRLEKVPKKVYDSTRNYPVTVIKSFKVYSEMKTNAKTYTLAKGDKITINGTDDNRWVRFVDATGREGWILFAGVYGSIQGFGSGSEHLDGLEHFD